MNDIDNMPSKCQSCPYWEACEYPYICDDIKPKQHENGNLNAEFAENPQNRPTNGDLISRQAAIDALNKGFWGVEWDKALATAMLNDLPSVQPKCGKWIERGTWSEGYGMGETYGKYWACNQCGREVKGFWGECGKNFCDNCGADMRGGLNG